MESIRNVALELERMVADKAATPEIAALMGKVYAAGGQQMTILAMMCRKGQDLLDMERVRQWPEEYAAALGNFILQMPYIPLPSSTPCGRKELFLAEALEDATVPKEVRIHLWRALVMDGYKFPCYMPGREWKVPRALYDHQAVRNWIVDTKQDGWEDIRCSDPMFFGNDILKQFKTKQELSALEAMEKDSPSSLLMPLSIEGRNLPAKYAQAALMKNAIKIVTYLYCNNKTFNKQFSPRQLLFYACANWNNDDTIPFVAMLEKDNPGLVKNSLDTFGHDALWYTLYQHDRFNRATEAARRTMDPLDKTLIELGCAPNRQNCVGLSYEDLTVHV